MKFSFDGKAALKTVREQQAHPNRPNPPNREGSEGAGLGRLGRLGNQRDPAAPDPDGVARTDEAIEKVWDDALAQAQEYQRTNTPPTCSRCGETDWRVSITEPDGRKLHVACWAAESPPNAPATGGVNPRLRRARLPNGRGYENEQ